jgi:hypothetical protein
VLGLIRSTVEYRSRLVRQLYLTAAGREPTSAELRQALRWFNSLGLFLSAARAPRGDRTCRTAGEVVHY